MMTRLTRPAGRRGAGLVLALAALGLAGCGPGKGDVSGKVTYKVKPVGYGSVQFIGPDRKPLLAPIGPDGSYRAEGVLAGDNQVAVNSPDPAMVVRKSKAGKPIEPPPADPKRWFPLPDKYADPAKSGLTLKVERNVTNSHDIDLK
jgi:hypothetical protein